MNLTEVILNDGKVIHRQEEISLETIETPDGRCPITWKTPLDLTVTNKGNRVLQLCGTISLKVMIPCARCLTEVETPLEISFDEEADMKLSEEARKEALDESIYIHGYELDIDQLVYGEALLAWPVSVLCREDCRGLCKRCGQNLNLRTCSCEQSDLDPRMAKIRDIFNRQANYKNKGMEV